MSRSIKKIAAFAAALVLTSASDASLTRTMKADAAYGVGGNGKAIMEYLDRGIYAVKSGNGMFVSWRFNADDPDDAEFRLYRDDKLIYTSKSGEATSYQDNGGNANSKYRVDCVSGGKTVSSQNCKFTSGTKFEFPATVKLLKSYTWMSLFTVLTVVLLNATFALYISFSI